MELPVLAQEANVEEAAVESGSCGENLTWKVEGGILTISGSGGMEDYIAWENDSYESPWSHLNESISKVVLENGVTSIGNYAFADCGMQSIEIPDSVVRIGKFALTCRNLKSIRLSEGILDIDEGAFAGSGLENIEIPSTITHIQERTFSGCNSLQNVKIPESVT